MADIEKDAVVDDKSTQVRSASPVDVAARNGSIVSTREGRKILEHSHDADEAMKAFENGEIIEISEADNKRLLRIIDRHMLPIMCVVYGLNYLDKTVSSILAG